MRIASIASLAAAAFAALGVGTRPALADTAATISGPHLHENLAIYFIRGTSAPGAVPLTLAEALAKGGVQVIETGRVNELQIENTSDEEVFVQAGDIVKGGRQDRVLTVSLVLPPRSGRIPISSFCVEQGRWSARGGEDNARFASASEALPSSRARVILAAPAPAPSEGIRPAGGPSVGAGDTASRQQKMWETVAKVQSDLSAGLNAHVASPQSATSLQLSLENEKLKEARAAYIGALEPLGLKGDDIIGYVVAINGKTVSGDVYTSNGLFRKMWVKQLAAAVTEAIGERASASAAEPPATTAVQEFLAAAERGTRSERETAFQLRQETRDSDQALYNETRRPSGQSLHKAYVRK